MISRSVHDPHDIQTLARIILPMFRRRNQRGEFQKVKMRRRRRVEGDPMERLIEEMMGDAFALASEMAAQERRERARKAARARWAKHRAPALDA